MKYRPIFFNTEMVQASLQGIKTKTRRTQKLENLENYYFQSLIHHATGKFTFVENGNYSPKNEDVKIVECPYGQIGDVLWVRESFCLTQPKDPETYYFGYKAGGEELIEASEKYDFDTPYKWKPSIHMPKEACRLFLKITDISVERLQHISEDDAIAEGVKLLSELNDEKKYLDYTGNWDYLSDARDSFISLWQSINGPGSWEANPWVWVIQFELIIKPIDFK